MNWLSAPVMIIFDNFSIGNALMILIGATLILLAIFRDYEPTIFLAVGFGVILVNLPYSESVSPQNILEILYKSGIKTQLVPLLLLISIGTMLDFSLFLSQPSFLLYGVVNQVGVICVFFLGSLIGFEPGESASISMISTFDAPTALFVSTSLSPYLFSYILVTLYLIKGLVPFVQPVFIKALTTRNERMTKVTYTPKQISRRTKILFPIFVTLVFGLILPEAGLMIGMLMLGNLLRESGAVDRLSRTVQNEMANLTTLFLGLMIGFSLTSQNFLSYSTIKIIFLGLVGYGLNISLGLLFGKISAVFSHGKINPLLCIAGTAPYPISAQLVAYITRKEDQNPGIVEPALAINTASQVIVILLGGVFISFTF